jgi:CHAT domain-containing protein
MGASHFKDRSVPPLPGAQVELNSLELSLEQPQGPATWNVTRISNEAFTFPRVKRQLEANRYTVLHLATHAQFRQGSAKESYIQFWDEPLPLPRLDSLNFKASGADLIVLSACYTAIGSKEAANGFAGMALKAGVPTAIGTLWAVDDRATAVLMQTFYQSLPTSRTKAQALQAAQIALIKGRALAGHDSLNHVPRTVSRQPYYWAGFSLISNPW